MDELKPAGQGDALRLRAQSPGYFWSRICAGIVIIGLAYILTFVGQGLAGFTYDATPGIPIIGNPSALLFIKTIFFVIPFSIGALFYRRAFRYRKHRAVAVTSGLLLAWAAEKLAILGLSAMIYSMPIWQLKPLLYRISAGGDQSAPWFTADYILLTLAGCIVLGLLASLGKRPARGGGAPLPERLP